MPKYLLTHVDRVIGGYAIISKHPWPKWKPIGEFTTTEDVYSAAMDLMQAHQRKNPHQPPLPIFKAVKDDIVDRVEIFEPAELDDVA